MGCAASASVPVVEPVHQPAHQRPVVEDEKVKVKSLSEFVFSRTLGEGTFGHVYAAYHCPTKTKVAIKTLEISKQGFSLKNLQNEVEIMTSVDHPNCVRLFDAFVRAEFVHLVMERAQGGDLLQRIEKEGPIPESAAAVIIKQLLEAQVYLHAQGIVHRDIKPNNILMLSNSPFSTKYNAIKLTDFGLSAKVQGDCYKPCLTSVVGTVAYGAPEMLAIALEDGRKVRGMKYGAKVDLWSTGTTLYHMLCGKQPFSNHGPMISAIRKIVAGDVCFREEHWHHIHADAMDFVEMLLCTDPLKRPTAAEALRDGKFWHGQAQSPIIDREASSCLSEASATSLSDTTLEIKSPVSDSERSSAATVLADEGEETPGCEPAEDIKQDGGDC